MAEVEAAPAQAPAAAQSKGTKKKVVKQKKPGPALSDLVTKAVGASTERSGVSLAALKKAIAADGYDVEKNKKRIVICVRRLVENGVLTQVKGVGASGSFKVAKKASEPKVSKPVKKVTAKAAKPAGKTAAASKKTKPAAARKPAAAKKPVAAKKPAAKKLTAKAKKPVAAKKSPKKTSKGREKAGKSPKRAPKVTKAAKKSPVKKTVKKATKPAAKKAAPKKK